jgi:hypothetical protein
MPTVIPESARDDKTERLAESMLAISGERAISDLYGAADTAFKLGNLEVAASLSEIAQAIERLSIGKRQFVENPVNRQGAVH